MLLKTPKQSQVQHKIKHFIFWNKNLNKSCAKNKLFSKNKIALQLLEIKNYLNIYVKKLIALCKKFLMKKSLKMDLNIFYSLLK